MKLTHIPFTPPVRMETASIRQSPQAWQNHGYELADLANGQTWSAPDSRLQSTAGLPNDPDELADPTTSQPWSPPASRYQSTAALQPPTHDLAAFEAGPQWSADDRDVQALPRADGGQAAWLLLAACFGLEALVWGFPFSYGIFQDYYASEGLFTESSDGIAAIGTTATGLMYFAAPFVAVAGQRWPLWRRPVMCAGAALMVLSLVAASFCNSVAGLLATEGVLYAVGGVVTYFPAIQYIDEWFVARKGLAYGVVWAGTGSAGIVVPFFSQWLLDSYGFRTTLRVWAVILAVLIPPMLWCIKGRLPVTASSSFRPIDIGYIKRAAFWVFEISIMFEGTSQSMVPLIFRGC